MATPQVKEREAPLNCKITRSSFELKNHTPKPRIRGGGREAHE